MNGVIRARPKIEGHVRFNGIGGFDPNAPLGILNGVFECAEPCVWEGQNKLLFQHMLSVSPATGFLPGGSEGVRSRALRRWIACVEVGGDAVDFLQ